MADYPTKLNELYCALGFVTAQWSSIEHSIDNYISLNFIDLNGKTIANRQQVPRSMNNKLTYLRNAFNKLPELFSFKNLALKLIDRVESISKKRQDIIHGVIIDSSQFHIEFTKLDYTKNEHIDRDYKFTVEDINQSGKKMQDLANLLSLLGGRLLHHFHPDLLSQE